MLHFKISYYIQAVKTDKHPLKQLEIWLSPDPVSMEIPQKFHKTVEFPWKFHGFDSVEFPWKFHRFVSGFLDSAVFCPKPSLSGSN